MKHLLEARLDLWKLHGEGHPIAITTNGVIKRNGEAVMGAGIAFAAKQRYPDLPFQLAARITYSGNHVFFFGEDNLYTFPTKHDWRDPSDIELIVRSYLELEAFATRKDHMIYMPHPGCGHGLLTWQQVKFRLESHFASTQITFVIPPWEVSHG